MGFLKDIEIRRAQRQAIEKATGVADLSRAPLQFKGRQVTWGNKTWHFNAEHKIVFTVVH